MTDRRTRAEFDSRKELQSYGWDVQQRDAVAFNSGSETLKHAVAKLLVARVCKSADYRVDTEVEMEHGEVDVLAYGHPRRANIVVEVETNPQDNVIADKIERYIEGEPVRECFVIDPAEMPTDMLAAEDWIRRQIW